MIKFLSKTLVTSVAVIFACFILKGVSVNSTFTAIMVAAVLGLLNSFVKPILVILTIPISILTLGLFLLVINTIIILLTAKLVSGFHVSGFWSAMGFSIVLSLVNSVLEAIRKRDERNQGD